MEQSEQKHGSPSAQAPAAREVKRGDLAPFQGLALAAAVSAVLWSILALVIWFL